MLKKPSPEFGSRILKRSVAGMNNQSLLRRGTIRVLAGMIACATLFSGWVMVSATEPEDSVLKDPAVTLHEPLAGQTCVECHEALVPSNGRCLLVVEGMCVLCHEIPVDGGQGSLAEPSAALCFKCHLQEGFEDSSIHGPYAAGDCLTCHSPHGGDDFGMVRVAGRQLCLTCHEDMEAGIENARFRHRATASGCTDCHSPHASEQRYQLRNPVPGVCEECHEDVFRNLETAVVTHSPVTEESACLNCHNPHVGEIDQLLLEDDMDLCLKCHNEPIKVGQYELALMGPLLAANPRHHGPIQFGECSECHNPHSSPYFRLLTDAYPERSYAPFFDSNYALCFRCHESTLAKEEHTESLTGFRDGDRSLHFVHVNKTSTGRTCRLCHEAHASSQPGHMRESVPFGTWDLPIKFNKTENGGSCEPGCHAAQSYDRLAAQTDSP